MLKYSRETNLRPDGPFETERFFLRPLGPEHETGMWEMFSNEDFTLYVPFELFTDREKAKGDYLEKIAKGKRFKFHFAIEWKTATPGEHNMAGFGMARPSEDGEHMEIGYCVVPRFWGQGIGTEITRIFVDVIAPEMGAKKEHLIAKIRPENVGSIKVAEKCGFKIKHKVDEDGETILLLQWQG